MTTNLPQDISELPEQYTAAELNFSRLPFFASDTKNLSRKDSITYEDTVTHEGEEIEIKWEVTANAKYGYPGPFAEFVHAALLDIITERGLPAENPFLFTFYDICKRLDIQHNGDNIRNIRSAIYSINYAGILIEKSFVTKDSRRPSYSPDGLYRRVYLQGDMSREADSTVDPRLGEDSHYSAVWLADFYLRSLNRGNIRPIDFEYFKHLHSRSFAATKIYQYLGYRFAGTFRHGNDYAKVDYDELATIADLKRQPYLSQAKRRLEKAHQTLLDTDFVRRIEWESEKQEDAPNKFTIYYHPGSRARGEYRNGRRRLNQQLDIPLLEGNKQQGTTGEEGLVETIPQDPEDRPKTTQVFTHELEKLGITKERARELDRKYSEERITRQLDHLAYKSKRGNSPDNVAGWLVRAIEEDYSPPSGFKDRKEQEARQRARQKARARAAERAKKKRERDKQQRKEQEARYRELDERFEELPEGKQQAIEEEIVKRIKSDFSDWMHTLYETREFDPKSPMHEGEYYNHLEALLDDRDEPE